MKRIYTLMLATFGLSAAAFAQRNVDLSVTLVSPAAGTTIQSGSPLDIHAVATNLGADTIRSIDTVIAILTIDGNVMDVTINGNQINRWLITNRTLAPNDTFNFNLPIGTFSFTSAANGQHEFCVGMLPVYRGGAAADTIADPVLNNNVGCQTLTFEGGTPGTGVYTIEMGEARNNLNRVFPNPATTTANFVVNMNSLDEVSVKVVDLAGRVVLTEHKGTMAKGTHTISVNTGGIAPGLYMYQVSLGKNVETGKLNIR